MIDDTHPKEAEATFARSLGAQPGDVFAAIERHKAERARRRRVAVVIVLATIVAALLVTGVALADELVREGRYVLVDDTDTVISEHNELHVAIREGQAWSREHDGRTFRIDPPRYRGSADADEPPIVDPSPVDPPHPVPSDARTIRVAPGDDIDDAYAQLRDGYPDQLLFERGGVYRESIGRWSLSGRSAEEPMVIGAYGDPTLPPPLFLPGDDRNGLVSASGDGEVSHVVFQDLRAHANHRDPDHEDFVSSEKTQVGIWWGRPGEDIRFERITLSYFSNNMNVWNTDDLPIRGVVLRDCVLRDAYADRQETGHSQGLYAKYVEGITIERCVFDHNGWHDSLSRAGRTGFNHNIYLSQCRDVVVRDSQLLNGSNMAIKIRGDEEGASGNILIEGSLFLGNLCGITAHGDANHEREKIVVQGLVVRDNVFTAQGGVIPGGAEVGHAVKVAQTDDAVIAGNLLIDLGSEINRHAFHLSGSSTLGDVHIERNILERWPMSRGAEPLTRDSDHDRLTLRDNWVERGAATRRPADYGGELSGMVEWLLEGIREPISLYTHHPALLIAYPGAFERIEVVVNNDIGPVDRLATPETIKAAIDAGNAGRFVPKLERAAANGSPVVLDIEPLPYHPSVVPAYIAAVRPVIAYIREHHPELEIWLYAHAGRNDATGYTDRMAGVQQAIAEADLDIDAIVPSCYQSREGVAVEGWLPGTLGRAAATGYRVIPIVWSHRQTAEGGVEVSDQTAAIVEGIHDAGIHELVVWLHWDADLAEPGVAENIDIYRGQFGR